MGVDKPNELGRVVTLDSMEGTLFKSSGEITGTKSGRTNCIANFKKIYNTRHTIRPNPTTRPNYGYRGYGVSTSSFIAVVTLYQRSTITLRNKVGEQDGGLVNYEPERLVNVVRLAEWVIRGVLP